MASLERSFAPILVFIGLASVFTAVLLRTGVDLLPPNPTPVGAAVQPAGLLILGWLVLRRMPGNWVGWTLAAGGVLIAIAFLGEAIWLRYGYDVDPSEHTHLWAAWAATLFGQWTWWLVLVWIPLLFPTGRLPGRAWPWRGFALLTGLSQLTLAVIQTFYEHLCVAWPADGPGCLLWIDNPLGIQGLPNPNESGPFVDVLSMIVGVTMFAALLSLFPRYWRSTGTERQQIRLVAFAALALAFVLVPAIVAELIFALPVPELLFQAAFLAIPAALAMSIIRYRLYEIDRLASRTLTYAVVVALLSLVFATGVVWAPRLLGIGDSSVVVAATTLAAAAMFDPLRKRLQAAIDRRFNRSRYDMERVMATFAGSLRDRLDPEGVLGGCVAVVSKTMQPTSVTAWVRET